MKMPIINFDDRFADFMSEWVKTNQDKYANFDEMEEDMPRIYMAFLNKRANWLGNVTPGAYFTQFEDPKVLVDWLAQYCEDGVPVPDLLCEQIMTVGRPCEKRLLELLKDEEAPEEARMIAVNLLKEMESTLPKMLYIAWQLNRDGRDDLKDNALEALTEMGECVVQPILQELPKANEAGEEALLEVLSHFPGNEQIFKLAVRLFKELLVAAVCTLLGRSRKEYLDICIGEHYCTDVSAVHDYVVLTGYFLLSLKEVSSYLGDSGGAGGCHGDLGSPDKIGNVPAAQKYSLSAVDEFKGHISLFQRRLNVLVGDVVFCDKESYCTVQRTCINVDIAHFL